MSFHFRFARLKNVRELEENLAEQRLALARQSELRQQEILEETRRNESQAFEALGREQALTAMDWELKVRLCHERTQATSEQDQRCVQASLQVERQREDLLLYMQKAQILQSLYERHSEAWRQQELQTEQKVIDEVGGVQHSRHSRTGR